MPTQDDPKKARASGDGGFEKLRRDRRSSARSAASSTISTPDERIAEKIRQSVARDGASAAAAHEGAAVDSSFVRLSGAARFSSKTPDERIAEKIRRSVEGGGGGKGRAATWSAAEIGVNHLPPSTPTTGGSGGEERVQRAVTSNQKVAAKIRQFGGGGEGRTSPKRAPAAPSSREETRRNAKAAGIGIVDVNLLTDGNDDDGDTARFAEVGVRAPGAAAATGSADHRTAAKAAGVRTSRVETTGAIPMQESAAAFREKDGGGSGDKKAPSKRVWLSFLEGGDRKRTAAAAASVSSSVPRPSARQTSDGEEPPTPPQSPASQRAGGGGRNVDRRLTPLSKDIRSSTERERRASGGDDDDDTPPQSVEVQLDRGEAGYEPPQQVESTESEMINYSPYGDVIATAKLVEDYNDEEDGGGKPAEAEAEFAMAVATAKPVPKLVRFIQDHCVLVTVVGLILVGGIAGLAAYLATRRGPVPTSSPTLPITALPTVSASPSVSMVPSGTPTLPPTNFPTETCNMPTEQRIADITSLASIISVDLKSSENDTDIHTALLQEQTLSWLTEVDSFFPLLCPGRDDSRLAQRYGLALMYFAMGGSGWRYSPPERSRKFLSAINECDWAGVDCNSDTTTVTRILLGARNIRGTIPAEIFSVFGDLVELNLADNRIEGTLPDSIAEVPNLEFLYLPNNRLSGSIPTVLRTLTRLEELDLSGNVFKGKLPRVLFRLKRLRRLNLENNDLTGALVPEVQGRRRLSNDDNFSLGIGNLTSLRQLDLSNNDLDGVLPDLFPPGIVRLALNNNLFSGGLPQSILQLEDLVELYLHWNFLTGSIPDEISGLTNLRILALSYNRLYGTIPDAMGELTGLEVARLDNNFGINGTMPASIRQLTKLKVLNAVGTNVVGNFSDTICSLSTEEGGNLRRLMATCEDPDDNDPFGNFNGLSCDPEWEVCCSCCQCTPIDGRNSPPSAIYFCDPFGEGGDAWSPFDDFAVETPEPMSPPDDVDRPGMIMERLLNASDESLLAQPGSAQAFAAEWIISQDPLVMDPNDVSLLVRYTIALLYFSTGGDEWLRCSALETSDCTVEQSMGKTRFLSEASACDWAGIYCDNESESAPPLSITIELDKNGLVGEIPLKELSGICMSALSLRGNPGIQIDFASEHADTLFGGLLRLDLSENFLYGSLSPTLLYYGPSMLYLNDNNFNGIIPSVPFRFVDGKSVLRLDYNQLSGSIPSEFGNFGSITELRLDNNFLTGTVPETLSSLDTLRILTLNNNDLTDVIPDSICDLSFNEGGALEDLWADCGLGFGAQIDCSCCTRCFE